MREGIRVASEWKGATSGCWVQDKEIDIMRKMSGKVKVEGIFPSDWMITRGTKWEWLMGFGKLI